VKARTVHGAYGAEMREPRRLMRALREEQATRAGAREVGGSRNVSSLTGTGGRHHRSALWAFEDHDQMSNAVAATDQRRVASSAVRAATTTSTRGSL
jgi:hypothetical protein